MKTKLVTLLIVVMTMGMLFSACQASEPVAEETTVVEETAADEESAATMPERKTVGVIIPEVTAPFTASAKRLLDHAAEALNVKLVYITGSFNTEDQLADVENAVSSGVDGIMMIPLVDAGIPKFVAAAEAGGIPIVQYWRYVVDQENLAALEQNEYFLGSSLPDDEVAGERMVELLAENGVTNVAVVKAAPGNDATDARQRGFDNAFANGVVVTLGENVLPSSYTAQSFSEIATNFINAYPDLEGIVMSIGASGGSDAVVAVIEQMSPDVKLATFDWPENTLEDFEKGVLGGTAVGMHFDPMAALIILVNEINGTPLADGPVVIRSDYIYLANYDEALAYFTYVDDETGETFPYTAEEIQQMVGFWNPGFSAADLQAVADGWNIDDLLEKLGQ